MNLEFPLRLRDYRMDACFSFLLEFEGTRILVWSSTRPEGAPRADLLTCRAVSSQRWYDKLLGQVQPRLVLPQHWEDTYQPLSDDPRPFFSAPRLGIPPIGRIDLADFSARVCAVPRRTAKSWCPKSSNPISSTLPALPELLSHPVN